MTRLLAVLCVAVALCLTPACAPKTIQDPAARAAYTADQLVIRLGEVQNAAIDASTANRIPLASGREIVTWISGDRNATPPVTGLVTVIQTTPSGWQATVRASWQVFRPKLDAIPPLAIYTSVIDALIGGL